MTYADMRVEKLPNKDLRSSCVILYDDRLAVGEESFLIQNKLEHSREHYLIPISRQWVNPITRFFSLKDEWESQTAHLSSVTEIAMHPAYQHIIGLGPVAIPLILNEMKKKSGHWFWALKAITGEDPVLPNQRGRINLMTEAWLSWGREQGYLQ